MRINCLKLVNFRNYEQIELTFNESLNIIYGNNGVGKTNLVEAIYTLAITKSFRTNNDKNLIKNGNEYAKIEGVVESNDKNNYQVIISSNGKKVKVDNNVISRLSEYINNINIVLLKPDEQIIFSESPAERRKLLNIAICQLEKDYLIYLNYYNQILKQRNFYLRELYINGNASYDFLDILTDKLITYGIKIFSIRKEFVDKINNYINDFYQKVFEEGVLKTKYISDYTKIKTNNIREFYKKNYNKEINAGKTLYGIQHDDLEFILENKNIVAWGSNGQQKNAILAFKLAEIEVIKECKNIYPILILDDLFSSLDSKNIKKVFNLLDNKIQMFITTTELKKISKEIVKKATLFKIDNGAVG